MKTEKDAALALVHLKEQGKEGVYLEPVGGKLGPGGCPPLSMDCPKLPGLSWPEHGQCRLSAVAAARRCAGLLYLGTT